MLEGQRNAKLSMEKDIMICNRQEKKTLKVKDKVEEHEKSISLESYLVRKRLKDFNPCHPPLSKITNQIKYISHVILTTMGHL